MLGGPPMLDEVEELRARAGIIPEPTEQSGGNGERVLLFNAPHHHAEMLSFDDDTDALSADELLKRRGNLLGHAFLDLQAASVNFHQARKFGKADDFLFRQIGNVAFAEEREHVMFAEAVKIDVFNNHHFIGSGFKQGVVQNGFWMLMIAAGKESKSFADATRRAPKAIALGVFSE